MRARLKKTELPLKTHSAILHDDAQFLGVARHRDRGRSHAGMLDHIAQQFPDDFEHQNPQIEIDGRIIRGDPQFDLQIVLAAHVNAEPFECRLQPEFVQARGTQIGNHPLRDGLHLAHRMRGLAEQQPHFRRARAAHRIQGHRQADQLLAYAIMQVDGGRASRALLRADQLPRV